MMVQCPLVDPAPVIKSVYVKRGSISSYPKHRVNYNRELEESALQKSDVQGRLQENIDFWREVLQAPSPIIDFIAEGYKLPLLSVPLQFARPNHRSAFESASFVTNSLEELTTNCCIRQIRSQPHICIPLYVVTNRSGKKRLILNLRF